MKIWIPTAPGSEYFISLLPPGVECSPIPSDLRQAHDLTQVEVLIPDMRNHEIPQVLGRMRALQLIQTLEVGVDWLTGCVPTGVSVCNARGTRNAAVADWVVGAILAHYKQFFACAVDQAAHHWQRRMLGDVAEKRVLLLGYGGIGQAIEQRLDAMHAQITKVSRRGGPGVHSLDTLYSHLPTADVVVLALPLTAATRSLVGEVFLSHMREDALLINVARGSVVDTHALLRHLHAGRLSAMLDVTDPEPLPSDHPLWSAPRTFVSPHAAGDTLGSLRSAWALAARQIQRHLRGESYENQIELEARSISTH